MKLTNNDLQNLANAIVMAGRDGDKPRNLPWKVAYALARTTAALKPHLEAIDAARKAIFEKHANGKAEVKQTDPEHAGLTLDLTEMGALEVEVSTHTFRLADIEGTSMAPVVLTALLPLIVE